MHRRQALAVIVSPVAAGAAASLLPVRTASAAELASRLSGATGEPSAIARDEDYWAEVQRAFTQNRGLINLNNGGVSPAPLVVQDAMARHLSRANSVPPPIALWREAPAQREAIRAGLARAWGVDAEELAITRNTTESLHICQHGFDLSQGDEVLTSDQDYPRMINAFHQRERRAGIKLVQVSLPVLMNDPAEVVRRFESAITTRTRMILCAHMVNLTGQVLPVKELCALGEARGIPVIVDGAHAFAHMDYRLPDLGCRYYGTSLHKWLFAPHGTGLLYVRRDSIESLWPLFAENPGQENDIRKFEEIGTHPAANFLAIAEALAFHEAIGQARKLARLRFLRDRWMHALAAHDRVRFNTNPEHAGGIANVAIDGLDPIELSSWLWRVHRLLVVGIGHEACRGLRVSPSVYTTLREIDRFVELIEHAMAHGIG